MVYKKIVALKIPFVLYSIIIAIVPNYYQCLISQIRFKDVKFQGSFSNKRANLASCKLLVFTFTTHTSPSFPENTSTT